jgi:hypothetical protein
MALKKIMVVLLLVIILLSACTPSITSGTVTAKNYEPSRVWVQLMPTKIGKVTTYTPITRFDDEDWVITIADAEGNEASIYVSEAVYNGVEIGSFFQIEDENTVNNDQ